MYVCHETRTRVVVAETLDGERCAIKIGPFETTVLEYSVAKTLVHPCIARPREMFVREESGKLVGHVVMDLLAEDLLTYVRRRGRPGLPVGEVRTVARRLVSALAYMHSRRLVHRDVKLDNVMLASPGECATSKLIDFGHADDVAAPRPGVRGTLAYMAPEILTRRIAPPVDMWSLGVTVYAMAFGEMPFYVRDPADLAALPGTNFTRIANVPDALKNFIARLLDRDPKSRMTALQAPSHPFLKD